MGLTGEFLAECIEDARRLEDRAAAELLVEDLRRVTGSARDCELPFRCAATGHDRVRRIAIAVFESDREASTLRRIH